MHFLKCCFNSGLSVTRCKPITNRSNLLSPCPWLSWNQFNPEPHWPNYWLTDSMTLFHSTLIALCDWDCIILWWIDLCLRPCDDDFRWFWLAVCLLSDSIPAFSFTIVIVLDLIDFENRNQFCEWRHWICAWDDFRGLCDDSSVVTILVI